MPPWLRTLRVSVRRDLNFMCVRVRGPAASSFPATSVGTSVYTLVFLRSRIFFHRVVLLLLLQDDSYLSHDPLQSPGTKNAAASWRFRERTTK